MSKSAPQAGSVTLSCEGCQTWSRERLALSLVTLTYEEIDWAGLRAAAVAIGIRRAGRLRSRVREGEGQQIRKNTH